MGCYGLRGAFQHPDVRIGWYPYVAIRDTEVRTNGAHGTLLKELRKGGGVGWQSTRNPVSEPFWPHRRLTLNGFAWVYTRAGTITGWVPAEDLAIDPNAAIKPPLLGPGGFDFEVGRTDPLPKKPSSCGLPSLTRPVKTVTARDVYLRYSERGTAFHYLHAGDKVRVLLSKVAHGYLFVEVVSVIPGSQAYPGLRGFLSTAAFT